MKKRILGLLCMFAFLLGVSACGNAQKTPRIGVSFGVGKASRWVMEQEYMEKHAAELGAEIEVRLNTTDEPTQLEDCKELIDSGIDVLILTPRDVNKAQEIVDYAKSKKVPVISYARVVFGCPVDLFVGYDSEQIGQKMSQYLTETIYTGDYIILNGDDADYNATLLRKGALRHIDPIRDDINVLLEASIPGWDPETAKAMVKEAVAANGNKVDAIFAPNDKIAGACAEALEELGVTQPVAITGMDAEIDAVKRIVQGKQDMTIYMDLEQLATTAIDEAVHMATGQKVNINAEFDNQSDAPISANLITGQLVIKQNLDKILIESRYFTRQEVYGDSSPSETGDAPAA